jgi:hypothetical protein
MDALKSSGSEGIVKLEKRNSFTSAIESTRTVVFLVDADGKVICQKTESVIGGTKDRPPLAPNGTNVFNFVISTGEQYKNAQVTFARIILEGRQGVKAGNGFQIEA